MSSSNSRRHSYSLRSQGRQRRSPPTVDVAVDDRFARYLEMCSREGETVPLTRLSSFNPEMAAGFQGAPASPSLVPPAGESEGFVFPSGDPLEGNPLDTAVMFGDPASGEEDGESDPPEFMIDGDQLSARESTPPAPRSTFEAGGPSSGFRFRGGLRRSPPPPPRDVAGVDYALDHTVASLREGLHHLEMARSDLSLHVDSVVSAESSRLESKIFHMQEHIDALGFRLQNKEGETRWLRHQLEESQRQLEAVRGARPRWS